MKVFLERITNIYLLVNNRSELSSGAGGAVILAKRVRVISLRGRCWSLKEESAWIRRDTYMNCEVNFKGLLASRVHPNVEVMYMLVSSTHC